MCLRDIKLYRNVFIGHKNCINSPKDNTGLLLYDYLKGLVGALCATIMVSVSHLLLCSADSRIINQNAKSTFLKKFS